MVQGFLVSLLISVVIFAVFFTGFPFFNDLKKEVILYFFLPMIAIGTLVGLFSEHIFVNRFRKLFLITMFLVYLTSLAYACMMILSDNSGMIKGTQIVTSILMLGSSGFLFYGFITVPLSLVAVFIIEQMTRPKF
jgi:uncharacterized membrane protein YqaE (UPF0057 family)